MSKTKVANMIGVLSDHIGSEGEHFDGYPCPPIPNKSLIQK